MNISDQNTIYGQVNAITIKELWFNVCGSLVSLFNSKSGVSTSKRISKLSAYGNKVYGKK